MKRSDRRDEVPDSIGWRAGVGLGRGRATRGARARSGAHPAVPGPGRLDRPCHRDRVRRVDAVRPGANPAPATSAVTRERQRDVLGYEQRQVSNVAFGGLLFSHWTPRRWTRTKPSPALQEEEDRTTAAALLAAEGSDTTRTARQHARRVAFGARLESGVRTALAFEDPAARARAQRRARRQARGGGRRARCGVGGGGERARRRDGDDAAGAKPLSLEDAVLLRALRWFKREFFTWCDKPACKTCGFKDVRHEGMGEPTAEERAHDAGRGRDVQVPAVPGGDAISQVQRRAKAAGDSDGPVRGVGQCVYSGLPRVWDTTRGGVSIGPITCGRRCGTSRSAGGFTATAARTSAISRCSYDKGWESG